MPRRPRTWPRRRCSPSGAGPRSTPRTRAASPPGSLPLPATCASTGCAARCPGRSCPKSRLEQASDEAPPDEALSEKERQARVRAALAELPPEQHEVVALSYLEGLSHGEIAARLGLPLGTVKSRMRIAYQRIRAGARGPEMTITHHLDDATLMSFAAGALPAALSAVAAAHVAMCPRCRREVAALERRRRGRCWPICRPRRSSAPSRRRPPPRCRPTRASVRRARPRDAEVPAAARPARRRRPRCRARGGGSDPACGTTLCR